MSDAFRDAGFAALERVRLLENENAALRRELADCQPAEVAELRAELERMRNALHNSKVPAPRRETRPRSASPNDALPLVVKVILGVLFCVVLEAAWHHPPARSGRTATRSGRTATSQRQASIGPISSPDKTKNASP